ncbi:serrate RNA effector molecule isoform X6 [Helianthus annuus]|uniref:serrate RNA effector molecule isoform X6 n=1 Tax=Helianthus annuus TaxID=4232 RepID=UPI001652EECD|nr:serrate RNA effector molecule isoform X6 [Helianthus annuus]
MFYLFIFFVKFLFCVKSYKHLSAFVNWESARGGYNDQVNTLREGLMSYKQFIQELEDGVLPSEAERRRNEAARKLAKEFLHDLQNGSLDLRQKLSRAEKFFR